MEKGERISIALSIETYSSALNTLESITKQRSMIPTITVRAHKIIKSFVRNSSVSSKMSQAANKRLLNAFWMPFTANRHFKSNHDLYMLASAKGEKISRFEACASVFCR